MTPEDLAVLKSEIESITPDTLRFIRHPQYMMDLWDGLKDLRCVLSRLSPARDRIFELCNILLELFETPENTPHIDQLDNRDFSIFLDIAKMLGKFWYAGFNSTNVPALYATHYGDRNKEVLCNFYQGVIDWQNAIKLPDGYLPNQNYYDIMNFINDNKKQ
ncbi:MAG: hypothetical protein LBF12_06195 [Christensenellaceae bacterium]|nr:hypothetical protein [Christensenellaceae bacterium]